MGVDVSDVVGAMGRYQWILVLLTVLRAFPTSWTLTSIDFIAGDVDHWCAPENRQGWGIEHWKEVGIPEIDGKRSKCQRYILDGLVNLSNATEDCDEWEYDQHAPSSALVDWDLVCRQNWKRSAMQSVAFVGQFIGALFIGKLSDRYGRRFMFNISTICMLLFGSVAALSPTINVFNVVRLLQAMSVAGLQTTTASLFTEIVLPKDRNLLNIGFSLGFTFPMMLLPLLAYQLNNWRLVQLSAGLSTLMLIPCMFFVQESPRWLLSKARISDAKKAILKIFRLNGRPEPNLDDVMQQLVEKAQADSTAKNLGLLDIWPHKNLRKTVICLFVFWFLENLFFFATTYLSASLGGSRFVGFAVSASAEIPGGVLSIFMIRYWRRRSSMATVLIAAAIASLVTAFLPLDWFWMRLGMNMMCRFCLVMSTAIKWIYTFELLPTAARSFGFSCCYCFGRLGGMVAPFMRDLAAWSPPSPHLILAACSVVASCILYFTPETLNVNLPDSFLESNQMGQKKKKTSQLKPL